MLCPYYSKAGFKDRLRGKMGFCELQKCDILRQFITGKVPHIFCEGLKGKRNTQCGVYVHFGRKERET